ncbi:PAS domain S-box protein [Saccharicrinis sp. FJH54]|uniref:PAS domain S-box protein n=1 Tax=Saccharicrinis sp. FJH54 TaxID=3344665 RepID=UPI0035D471DD
MSDRILIRKGLTLLHSRIHSPLATWEWSAALDSLTCSSRFFEILNIPVDKRYLTVEEQSAYFTYNELKKLAEALYSAFDEGIPFETEIKLLRGKDDFFYCMVYGYPVFNENKEVISVNGTLKDITKANEDKSILKEVLQYQKEIFDFSTEAIFILDAEEHKIVEVNKTCEELSGYSQDELSGKTIFDLCGEKTVKTLEKVSSYLKKVIIDDEPQTFDCLIKKRSGEEVWLEVLAKYVEINHVERIILSARDISQRKITEQQNHINELRQKFLINISLFKAKGMEDLLDYVLGEVLKNTKSVFGYLHYIDNDNKGILVLKNLRDRFEVLSDEEKETFGLLEDKTIWRDLVLLRRPVIDNDFNIHLHKKDVFTASNNLSLKYMSIPVFKNNRIVATIAVTNAKKEYGNRDVEDLISFMESIWEIIDLKEFSERNKGEDNIYMSAIDQAPYIIEQYNREGLQIAANKAYEKLWGFPASTTINSFNILKSIEIRNSGLYEYVLKAYDGESVLVPEYRYDASYNTKAARWFNTRIYPVTDNEGFVKGITVVHEDITDRKLNELKNNDERENLKQRSKLISGIINEIPASIFWKDLNGVYKGCNKRFAAEAGLRNPESIEGKTDDNLSWTRDLRKIRSRDIDVLSHDLPVINAEMSYISEQNKTIWLNTTLIPLHKSDSGFDGVLGIYEDITPLKELEKSLEEKVEKRGQQRFSLADLINYDELESIYKYISESLQNQFPDSVVAFTSTNQSETKLTVKSIRGISSEQEEEIRTVTKYNIYGKNINIYPTNYEIYKRGKLIEFKGGLDLYFGIQFPSSDARKIENILSINNIYTMGVNHGDKLLGVLHLFSKTALSAEDKSDIESILRQAAFVLERRTLDFKDTNSLDSIYHTIENASDAMLVIEAKNGIISASNKKSEALFNRVTEDMVGFHYSSLIPSPFRDDFNKQLNNAIKQNTPLNGEFWVDKAHGNHVPVIISSSFISANNKSYILLVLHNIDKRKEAETLIEQQNKELQQLISTKDKLFSIISHDLKNPLTGIVGFAEVVKEELPEDEDSELTKFMDIIIRSADSMVYLINNLLHWSRIQQGVITAKFVGVNIYDVVEREFELLFTAANNKKIDLINQVDANTIVYADAEMISTVIRNLVSNSIKFTQDEGTISVKAKTTGNTVEVTISDSGIGMDEEIAKNLFKINSETQRKGTSGEKGTGLGLVICKDFVEQNNGTIWVDSTLNVGSNFHFTLPKFNG